MRIRMSHLLVAASLATVSACGEMSPAAEQEEELGQMQSALVAEHSLAVTNKFILEPFVLKRVLDQLVSQAGIPGMTSLQLFNQWWDTQNTAPGAGPGTHCDDQTTWLGQPGLNEYPWQCPRLEGFQAGINPFDPRDPLYIPIGLFNRFDQAPSNGSHCGEYRIVYAMRPGHKLAKGSERNFIIFEAVLPNPNLSQGLAGCYDVQKYWAELSHPSLSATDRKDRLEAFYFKGVLGFPPVVHLHHYGLMLGAEGYGCSTGQIRTNQFNDRPWSLREFKLTKDCRCGTCAMTMVPITVKSNPYGDLFRLTTPEPNAADLQSTLVGEVPSLMVQDLNGFGYSLKDHLNAAESPVDSINHYSSQVLFPTNGPLLGAIGSAIPPSSVLTPEHIVARVQALSCAGCHELSNGADLGDSLQWPPSLGFVHVGEFILPSGNYPLSPAMHKVFLPFRLELLKKFLDDPYAFPGNGQKCEMKLPPGLEMDKKMCEEIKKDPKIKIPFDTAAMREMRESWEGRNILGRRSGH